MCRQLVVRLRRSSVADMPDHVTLTFVDDVAHIAIDDGKANALSHAIIDSLNDALDRAVAAAKADRGRALRRTRGWAYRWPPR